jgi:hypothetical protein
MITNQKASTYAELFAFVGNNKASVGRYLVENDETNLGNPIEYYYDGSKLIVTGGVTKDSGGAGLPTMVGETSTYALVTTDFPTPKANEGVIVTSDETHSNRRTWYVYDGSGWVYKGLYKGDTTQEENSLTGTRGAVIAALTDYQLPNAMQYTVGASQLTIMMNNQVAIKGIDWKEIGVVGVQSKIIQFLYTIPVTTNLVFRKDVASTDLMYMQRNIDMDLIRKQTCNFMGVVYGGEIQYTTLREAEKVYWCNVNQKWYIPKFTNMIPAMTSNSQDGWVLSSSTYTASYETYRAFDNIANTHFISAPRDTAISALAPETITIEKATPFHMNAFLWTGCRDGLNNGILLLAPKSVKIEGYNGSTWTTIVNFTDVAFDQSLMDGDLIGFNNTNSYYKYKFTIYTLKYDVVSWRRVLLSRFEIYSGKGSWSIADSDWTEFDEYETKRFEVSVTDATNIALIGAGQVVGYTNRKSTSIEIDWSTNLSTALDNTLYKVLPLHRATNGTNIELGGSNGGLIIIRANGTMNYYTTVDTPTKRSWFQCTYPSKKEVRVYV